MHCNVCGRGGEPTLGTDTPMDGCDCAPDDDGWDEETQSYATQCRSCGDAIGFEAWFTLGHRYCARCREAQRLEFGEPW